ncbi:hypothetical protein Dshi_4125 (plasmid) [Dinoroseobacter shibae DFL 12 = DSM 16493]|jgi:hypothetical protein|uniref:Uncharacterized protein n=1 Tax=Dinoroseobacter shibae (strain DSM 16493 / NCIMB 14021 / DFL 12) TaxID=398580 RepID=A8LUC3_DINSH|nr:hypothetical protein [Dinoroseobacter shibae]ABV95840.1 hypothetical protein Dshi_4125 [Dinoroseobacter shibae DFL 12 = DSM 16493]URF49087.1 hypothetical protein M8008_21105 [Dinoroseobacter shibae]URF53396.1 hypothetical protein M8007_21130 [Dinoroseobacter shibae]
MMYRDLLFPRLQGLRVVLCGLWLLAPGTGAAEILAAPTRAAGPEAPVGPAPVVFGLRNAPDSAAVPTELGDGQYFVEGAVFSVRDGRLSLAAPPTTPWEGLLSDGTLSVPVAIRADHLCVATDAELDAALRLPAAEKSGLTLCLGPGRFGNFKWHAHRGAFVGLDPARPMVVTSRDPANPAILSRWIMGSTDDRPNGDLILRDLVFELDAPQVTRLSDLGFRGVTNALELGWKGIPTRNMVIERVAFRGPLGEAFAGALPVERILNGINGYALELTIRDVTFSGLMNSMQLQGEDILVEHTRTRHGWGDMLRISAVRLPEGRCRQSRNIVFRNNIMENIWSNNQYHPDAIHMFPVAKIACGVSDVTIEGNIVYMGAEGTRQPGFITGFRATDPMPVPDDLPFEPSLLHRFEAPGTTRLPAARCPERRVQLGIQKLPSEGVLRVLPPEGQVMTAYGRPAEVVEITGPWEVLRIACNGKGVDQWDLRGAKPGPQGFFSNNVVGPEGYSNLKIRHNVLWITSPNGIRFSDPDNRGLYVHHNSLLQPFPGDANGDGRPHTSADGFNPDWQGARLLLTGADVRVHHNISATLGRQRNQPGWNDNDDGLRSTDLGRSMRIRFGGPGLIQTSDGPQPGVYLPTTPREAIEMARPLPGEFLDNRRIGAVAGAAERDWYDWSWVPDR